MPHPSHMVDDPVKRRPQSRQDAIVAAMAEKATARAAIPARTSFDMIEAVLDELNRQLDPLLKHSKARELDDDELDRMIRISSATIAIHRQLTDPAGERDLSKIPMSELRKLAGKKK